MKLKFLNIIKESFYLKKIYHGSFRKKTSMLVFQLVDTPIKETLKLFIESNKY